MRVVVFALAAVSILSGVSAYADRMVAPVLPETGFVASLAPKADEVAPVLEAPSAQLLDARMLPESTALATATPAAVTAEPSGVVLMATGLIGIGGLLWKRRSLIR